jgi:hypothetical protein
VDRGEDLSHLTGLGFAVVVMDIDSRVTLPRHPVDPVRGALLSRITEVVIAHLGQVAISDAGRVGPRDSAGRSPLKLQRSDEFGSLPSSRAVRHRFEPSTPDRTFVSHSAIDATFSVNNTFIVTQTVPAGSVAVQRGSSPV